MHTLENLGWDASFASVLASLHEDRDGAAALVPARVTEEQRDSFRVRTQDAETIAVPTGRLRHRAAGPEDRPAVGDWVAVTVHDDFARIHHVLPRRTALVRKVADARTAPQVVAANVDTAFLATSLNADFNPRRLERALALVWESGAAPVVLLTKADLCEDVDGHVAQAEAVAFGVPVHAISAVASTNLDLLDPYLGPGRTVALLGSSGVGKSTLANVLLGEERMETTAIRADDDRGRHTTTARHLLPLPGGGALVDTPGLRAVALWDADTGLAETFEDVASLAAACRFKDCSHEREPGCAVRAAVAAGSLAAGRLASWRKLRRELAFVERKRDGQAARDAKRRWKTLTKEMRRRKKDR